MRLPITNNACRFFSSAFNKVPNDTQISGFINKIEVMRKAGNYQEALDLLSTLETQHPAIAFKAGPMIRGQLIVEQLRSSGELYKFKSPFLRGSTT